MKKIILGLMLMLAFVGCTALSFNSQERLVGKEYVLVGSTDESKISINFAEENFFGFSGVNNYFGKYKTNGNEIKLTHVGSTMMAGPQDLMTKEHDYLSMLGIIKSYKVSGRNLFLTLEDGTEMVFKEYHK